MILFQRLNSFAGQNIFLNVEAYQSKDGRNILGVPVVHALLVIFFLKNYLQVVETKVRTDFGKVYQEKGEFKEIICLGFGNIFLSSDMV